MFSLIFSVNIKLSVDPGMVICGKLGVKKCTRSIDSNYLWLFTLSVRDSQAQGPISTFTLAHGRMYNLMNSSLYRITSE